MRDLDLQEVSAFTLAVVGLLGWLTSSRLSKRGQRTQELQSAAAAKMAERVQTFEEIKEVAETRLEEVQRLREDLERARGLLREVEDTGNLRLSAQAARCRDRLEGLIAVVTTLKSVVVSEIAQTAAADAAEAAERHLDTDHPEDPSST